LSAAAGEERFIDAHEAFLRELAGIDDDLLDRLDGCLAAYADFFSLCQRRYLAIKEKEANAMMMTRLDGIAGTAAARMVDGFGRDSYERVRDLKDMVDFSACRHVVMVGSGAFPATLFWLHDHFPTLRYAGLDVDAGCVAMATKLANTMGIDSMRFEVVDGTCFDFSSADFVYVANHVTPKKGVLEQVGRSGSNAQVVVREPTRRGKLVAEAVCDELPSVFTVQGSGSESRAFLSYDLLLRRT
jgi:hypothetical protein